MQYSSLFCPFSKRPEQTTTPKDISPSAKRLLFRLSSKYVLLDEYYSNLTKQSYPQGTGSQAASVLRVEVHPERSQRAVPLLPVYSLRQSQLHIKRKLNKIAGEDFTLTKLNIQCIFDISVISAYWF